MKTSRLPFETGNVRHHFLFFLLYGLLNAIGFYLTGRFLHVMLVWNVLLAAIPLALAQVASREVHRRIGYFAGIGFLWLLFWPNAYYMVTDFIHIAFRPFYTDRPYIGPIYSADLVQWSMPLCIGVGMVYASLCGAVSQRIMAQAVRSRFGIGSAAVFVAICSVLCGAAIYIGRFLRVNSWDILRPQNIWQAFQSTELPLSFSLGIIAFFALYAIAVTGVVALFASASSQKS